MVTPPEGDDRDVVETFGADRPLLRERWQALSRRTRVTIAASISVVVLSGLADYVITHRAPPPDPAAATHVRITDVGRPDYGSPFFGITLRMEVTSSVTVVAAENGYGDLVMYVGPVPGTPLDPGHARTLYAHAAVSTCQLPHPPRGTPLLYLTLRTARGDRLARVVPTQAQFERLDDALRLACAS